MSIHFVCPHCGMQTQVAETYAGQTGPCAGCGRTITVPPVAGTPGYTGGSGNSSTGVVIAILGVLVLLFFVLCGGGFFFMARTVTSSVPMPPTMPTPAPATPTSTCVGNLQRIGKAMQAYYLDQGAFPPAYVADEDGTPMHSWRVLLLPYLDEKFIYDQYHFDEPWDSPANQRVADQMPSVYQCPDDYANNGSQTSYLMIVGPESVSDGSGSKTSEDFRDGLGQTIVVIEASASGVDWLDPRDLDAQHADFHIPGPATQGTGLGIRSNHSEGVHALFADGKVRRLSEATDPAQVEAMTTVSGGEPVEQQGEVVEYVEEF